jgi:hypothetical protein
MDIQRNLLEIGRYISLDSQKRDFSFLKEINVNYVMMTVIDIFKEKCHASDYLVLHTFVCHADFFGCPLTVTFT